MKRVLVIGPVRQDIYLMDHDDLSAKQVGGASIFENILPGSNIAIDRLYSEVGGSGLNTAVGLARYGHEVILMGNICRDAAGDAVMRVVDDEDIDNSYMGVVPRGGTGTSVILLNSINKEQTNLNYYGASTRFDNFREDDLELANPEWLIISSLGGDLETLERFLVKAHEMDIKVALKPSVKELARHNDFLQQLKYVDVLEMNKTEASALMPGVVLTELFFHLGNYVPVTIITDGSMGGIAGTMKEKSIFRFGIYEDVKIKDTNGAGDAFFGGFMAKYIDDGNLTDAIVFGSANATAAVQTIGANNGLLYGDEPLHMMPMQKI